MRAADLFFASRPLLQLPIWTVYLISLHYHHLKTGESFHASDLLMMLGISLLFTGAAYLNQVYDFDSDLINDKVGFLQKNLLTSGQMLNGFLVVSILPLVIAPFVSIFVLFLFSQFVLLAYIYSVPPIRLKDRPIGGLMANGYAHGTLVALAVMPHLDIHNAGLLGWDLPFYFFFAVGAIYILTTIPDLRGDAATGKKTLAVVLGRTGSALVAVVFLVMAVAIAYTSHQAELVYLALFAIFLTLATLLLKTDSSVRLAAKAPLFILTLLAGYHYWGYLLFVVALLLATRAYYFKRFGVIYPELN